MTLRQDLAQLSRAQQENVHELGPMSSDDKTDYPDVAQSMVQAMLTHPCAKGVLICATGIGMSIAANRFSGIRAGLCRIPEEVAQARRHNDINILVLGARITPLETAWACMMTFITTAFEGGRHVQRLAKLDLMNKDDARAGADPDIGHKG